MKKHIFIFTILTLLASDVRAQTAFKKGEIAIQLGIGYGLMNTYGDVKIPPISLTVDYGYNEELSVGGYVGYATSREVIFPKGYLGVLDEDMGAEYSYFILGGRLCYHFDAGNRDLDGYIGAMLGINIASATTFGMGPYNINPKASALLYGVQLGGRYFFTSNTAFFTEVGYGIGYITGGLSFKL